MPGYTCNAMGGSDPASFAVGETNGELKTQLNSHAQQLSEDLFLEYTEHCKGTAGSEKGTRSSEGDALLR